VAKIIQECYQRAERILTEHMDQLHLLAKTLLERETVDGEELRMLLAGEPLPPPRAATTTNGRVDEPEKAAEASPTEAPALPRPQMRPGTATANQGDAPPQAPPRPASS